MSEPLITTRVQTNVATITLNRPAKRNALSRALLGELHQAFCDLHMQKSVRAVVLCGAGPAFCAGMDLNEMSQTANMPSARELWEQDARVYLELVETMLRFPKPIIAAVAGAALAGGAGLVLASDIVVASNDARFGLPEPKRGIVAGMVAALLYFRVGGSRAAYLLLTASHVDAKQACDMGLFHELVDSDQLSIRANELAETCARCAPEALALTKRMLNETIGDPLITQLSAGAAVSSTARTTAAAKEGLAAFLEKREPDWDRLEE